MAPATKIPSPIRGAFFVDFCYRNPALLLAALLLAGILGLHHIPWPVLLASIVPLLLAAVVLWYRHRLWAATLLLGCTVACTGGLLIQGAYRQPQGHIAHLPKGYYRVQGQLQGELRKTARGYRAQLAVQYLQRPQGQRWLHASGQVLLYLPAGCTRPWLDGQQLELAGSLVPLADTGYHAGLRRRGLTHRLVAGCATPLPTATWQHTAARIQQRFSQQLAHTMPPGEVQAVARAMLLDDRTDLDADTRKAYADSGVAHILALSGAHMSMLALLLYWVLYWLGPPQRHRVARLLLLMGLLVAYAVVTGLNPSVVRAVLLSCGVLGAQLVQRPARLLNLTGLCMLLQLAADPTVAYSLSFQLSYAAVLGIVLGTPLLYPLWRPRWQVLRLAWGVAVVSLMAQLFTLPIILHQFGQFPAYFLPVNLVLAPPVFVSTLLGLVLLALMWVPLLGPALGWVLQVAVGLCTQVARYVSTLPGARLPLTLSEPAAWAIGLTIVLLVAVLHWRRSRFST